ncbi:hypothetical protein, conserved [Trypanosoma brucei brucei TREU927]|uniref:Uncharacterized protein n=1 Tax=Trypanosoma brucei brucei (strain 927/4 GUTat10.1) TaxID=185431 RepID=Q582F7_TRYB2|nr:hypothetical protein, conserved [Trypanosoma brucei brucei TREU927]AAX78874.1 hypothetical protein, conserved [Trypanosoma brucei]AAZ12606.1 hypothetical protein, conserved [Trypanosoma brucei brucei TREU927]
MYTTTDLIQTRVAPAHLFVIVYFLQWLFVASTASGESVHAIFKISKSGDAPFFKQAERHCERAKMRLATPTTAKGATAVKKLLKRCGPSDVPVLGGGLSVRCSSNSFFFLWSPKLDEPKYPVEDTAPYCGERDPRGWGTKCVTRNRSAGRLFYQFHTSEGEKGNCTGPVTMDYDPAILYELEVPSAGEEGLLAWVVSRGGKNGSTAALRSLRSDLEDTSRAYIGDSSKMIEYVLCEGGRSSVVSSTSCYSVPFILSVASSDDKSHFDHRHNVTIGILVLIVLILIIVAAFLILWLLSRNRPAGDVEENRRNGSDVQRTVVESVGDLGGTVRSESYSGRGSKSGDNLCRPENVNGNCPQVNNGFCVNGSPQQENLQMNAPGQQPNFNYHSTTPEIQTYSGEMELRTNFGGPILYRQGSFRQNITSDVNPTPLSATQRPGSFRGSSPNHQGCFNRSDVFREPSLYGESPPHGDPRLGLNHPRDIGYDRGNAPEQVSLSSVGMAQQGNFANVGARGGNFRGINRNQQGSFRNSNPPSGGLFNT